MTEPKDDVPGATEDESASDASPESDRTQPVDLPLPDETALGEDPDAARAEAEAAALAANEVDAEEVSGADDAVLETNRDFEPDPLENGGAGDDASDVAGAELVGAPAPGAAGATAADRRTGR